MAKPKMTKKDAMDMAKDIVGEIDYDIYKDIFLEGHDDPETQSHVQNELLAQVSKYVDIDSRGTKTCDDCGYTYPDSSIHTCG